MHSHREGCLETLTTGTVYDYIRDHLGYRLELSSATASVSTVEHASSDSGGSAAKQQVIRVEMELRNNGFGAPVNARDWSIALLSRSSRGGSGSSKVVWQSEAAGMISKGADWRLLYPHLPGDPLRAPLSLNITLAAHLPEGSVKAGSTMEVGVALLDPLAVSGPGGMAAARAMAVRFTNPRWWAEGVNVLGLINV